MTTPDGPEDAGDAPVQCPHASRCAGCPSIDLDYNAQRDAKRSRVARALGRYPALAGIAVANTEGASPRVAYRTRAKFTVGVAADGSTAVGLFDRDGTHRTVDIPSCVAIAPVLTQAADAVRALVRDPPAHMRKLFTPVERGGALHAIDLREVRSQDGRTQAIVTLVLDEPLSVPEGTLMEAAKRLQHDLPTIASVAVSLHATGRPTVLGGVPHVVLGPLAVRDTIVGRVYALASPGAFVQAHRDQAARIYARVGELLAQRTGGLTGRKVVDAYAGAGALGLTLASRGARVRMIESFLPAVDFANEAAHAQGLDARATHGDVGEVLLAWAAAGKRPDAVVLNPPRRGVSPDVRDAVGRLGPRVLVYVSCEPMSLARDLDHLERLGYHAARAEPFDLMPQTPEVETVVLAVRGEIPAPPVLYDDPEVIFVDKGPHEPVTAQGEHAFSLMARVHERLSLPEAVPVQRLDEGTSGVCVLAKSSQHLAAWTEALSRDDAVKSYIALVRGIARDSGTNRAPLIERGKALDAVTRYERLEVIGGHSLVRVTPETGRKHQIRRHLAQLEHEVLGDARHGHAPSNRHFAEKYLLDRPFLHCAKIELTHPHTGERLVVESPLPGDLASVLERLRG